MTACARLPALAVACCVLAAAGCGGARRSGPDASAAGSGAEQVANGPIGAAGHRPCAPAPLVARGVLHGAAARRVRVPILMYHVIAAPPAGTPYPALWTPPVRFAAQMAALHTAGFTAVTLDAVVRGWSQGAMLPARPLVVTFDDGYLGDLTRAAPILCRYGWPGVLNLETHNMHVAGGLSPTQVQRLLGDGWELGAHTISHPDLTTVGPARLRGEVAGSRRLLRHRFAAPVRAFAYPSGRYDSTVQAAVRAAGFQAAVTTDTGIARGGGDMTALPRVRVDGTDTPATVVAAAGG